MVKWHPHVVEEGMALYTSGPRWHLIIPLIYQCQVAHSGVCVHVHHSLRLPPASSHSTKLIVSVLQCGDIIPEATSVMELLPSRVEARSKPDFPVIVIEGLDATG